MLPRLTVLALLAWFAAPQGVPPEPVTVAAAVSLTQVLEEIAAAYATAGGGPVRFNLAGSNVLSRQILNGAPADVFISADEAQMDVVEKAGAVLAGSRVDLVENQLAIVSTPDRVDFVRQQFSAGASRDSPPGDRRSGGRAGWCLRAPLSRAAGALGCLRAADRADNQCAGRAWRGRDRQR